MQQIVTRILTALCFLGLPHFAAGAETVSQSFERLSAQAMFSAGLQAMTERSLTVLEPAELALAGMQGLASLDPNLTITRSGPQIVLADGRNRHAAYSVPAESDIEGWADITSELILDVRQISSDIAERSQEDVYQAVFDAMTAKLDIFSRYAGVKEAAEHRAARNGFGGVGLRYEATPTGLTVIDVIFGGPADRANIRAGDLITHIDNLPISLMDEIEINRRLRGMIASEVLLTIQRPDVPETVVSVHRALVIAPTVRMVSLEKGIAHITVSGFNQRTVSSLAEVIRTAQQNTKGALRGIILDLRDNPGGLLDQAVGMADLFMAHGTIVSAQGRYQGATQHYEATSGDLAESIPLIVLINGETASSAEIVAAALQDSGRGIIVGSNSYGKGTIQTVLSLPNTGELTLTWSRFHSPSGYTLQGLGILPTFCTSAGKSVAELIHGAQTDSTTITATQARWRTLPADTPQDRQALRAQCPLSASSDSGIDEEIAYYLFNDRKLFTRALKATRAGRQAASQAAARTEHK